MAVRAGRISGEQWHRLNHLRVQRNRVMHETLQLEEPQARAELEYLEQIIAQLCP